MIKGRKPKLLIIGHGRHGKDTVAEMIQNSMDLKFTSSSLFVAQECIWNAWGKERYQSFEDMFEDRHNYRKTWADLISAYNTPDKTRTARTMIERGYDMYVGMRRADEFEACKAINLFDYVIWVDASKRMPLEPSDSMEMYQAMAQITIDNNGPESALIDQIEALKTKLHYEGFDVNYEEQTSLDLVPPVQLDWTDMPQNAVKVLDHGFFIVREVMGSDKSIVEAARMSYGRGTKKVNDDKGLINYLVHNHHTSPLEMGEIKVHMRLPIFVMRQLVRHRTANLNEYSGRYSEMVRLFYIPEPEQICAQDKVNKQGSAEPLDPVVAASVQSAMRLASNSAFDCYEALLKAGVSRETARIVLPLNTYTEVVWKLDVSNLLKFLSLRDDPHAQYEIRVYAKLIAEAVEHFFPLVYAAYLRERACVTLTPGQLKALITGDSENLSKSEAHQVNLLLDEYLTALAAE